VLSVAVVSSEALAGFRRRRRRFFAGDLPSLTLAADCESVSDRLSISVSSSASTGKSLGDVVSLVDSAVLAGNSSLKRSSSVSAAGTFSSFAFVVTTGRFLFSARTDCCISEAAVSAGALSSFFSCFGFCSAAACFSAGLALG